MRGALYSWLNSERRLDKFMNEVQLSDGSVEIFCWRLVLRKVLAADCAPDRSMIEQKCLARSSRTRRDPSPALRMRLAGS